MSHGLPQEGPSTHSADAERLDLANPTRRRLLPRDVSPHLVTTDATSCPKPVRTTWPAANAYRHTRNILVCNVTLRRSHASQGRRFPSTAGSAVFRWILDFAKIRESPPTRGLNGFSPLWTKRIFPVSTKVLLSTRVLEYLSESLRTRDYHRLTS